MEVEQLIWSINDLASYVGVSLDDVRKMLRDGLLPPGHRSGKHVFWYSDEVMAWREARDS